MFAILFSVLIVCNPIYFLSHSLQSLFIVFLSVGLSPSLLLSWSVQWSCVPLFVYFPFGLFPSRQSPLFACIPVCLSLLGCQASHSSSAFVRLPLFSDSFFCLLLSFVCVPLLSVTLFGLSPFFVCCPHMSVTLSFVALFCLSLSYLCLLVSFVCRPLLSVTPFCLSPPFVCRSLLSVALICLSPSFVCHPHLSVPCFVGPVLSLSFASRNLRLAPKTRRHLHSFYLSFISVQDIQEIQETSRTKWTIMSPRHGIHWPPTGHLRASWAIPKLM